MLYVQVRQLVRQDLLLYCSGGRHVLAVAQVVAPGQQLRDSS
jgi:hypothetical protein